jgi:hypothetical protein
VGSYFARKAKAEETDFRAKNADVDELSHYCDDFVTIISLIKACAVY